MSHKFDAKQKLALAWRETMVGKRYRHYKGSEYVVVRVSVNEPDGGILVTYVSELGDEWTRTLADFLQPLAEGVHRFTRIEE